MNLQNEIQKILEAGFIEDIGNGDVTTNSIIPEDLIANFVISNREEIVFCGYDIIDLGFYEQQSKIFFEDGEKIDAGSKIALIKGNIKQILSQERTILNLLQYLSGIATETAKYVTAVEGTKAKILDTRKTIPGLRMLSKYAVKCGGGQNHRMGLYDMVMIKDNHITAAGGITSAVKKARSSGLKIEVECDSLEQVREALAAGADIIMADNMPLDQLKQAVAIIGGKVPLEASGNVSLETISAIAETGVDFISTSKITMSARAVDIGLDAV